MNRSPRIQPCLGVIFLLAAIASIHTQARAGVTITASGGYSITWDGNDGDFFDAANPALAPGNLASSVGTQIQSSFLAASPHNITGNVNDGEYGNISSWIAAEGDATPYIGIDLNGTYDLNAIAWSRDNGNTVSDPPYNNQTDRSLGLYTVQITNELNPAAATAWTTIGTLEYVSNDDTAVGGSFTSYYRHQYDIARNDSGTLLATGVRLLVPGSGFNSITGTAIDELELYGHSPVPTAGLLSWVRGDGDVQTSGATLTQWSDHSGNGNHVTPTTSPPDLVAGAINGLPAVEFGTSIEHANAPVLDSLQDSDYEIFIVARTSDASNQFLTAGPSTPGVGEYELLFNGPAGARFTPSTDNATTDGTHADIFAELGVDGMFSDGRAHIVNTRVQGNEGFLRVVGMENGDTVLNARSSFSTDERLTLGVRGNSLDGFVGEMGEVLIFDHALSETERRQVERYLARKWDAPLNVASQTQGGIAFANQLYNGGAASAHQIDHLNNALYGNTESWLGDNTGGAGGFAGVKFDGAYDISSLAFGRAADGGYDDRAEGTYIFQYTLDDIDTNSSVSVEGANWVDFMTIVYDGTSVDPWLRHQYDFATILGVRAVRVWLSNDLIAIDELEVYGLATIPEPATIALLTAACWMLPRRRAR
ncbi:hypothetical protein HED60_11385 [Planctomycetales bacterium ZRK34]|nr:hypothetical protein HED60_11385 [Planctomycetales bacterium ZRK34]